MEDCMLSLDELEQAAGGTFQFFKGGTLCKVQGQKFTCSTSGQRQIINLINANPDMSEAEIMNMAVSKGILNPV